MAGVKGRSGGPRVGCTKLRKIGSVRWRREQRKLRSKPATGAASASVKHEAVAVPSDLPANQTAVWALLAPHATAARTLTPATAFAFADLCDLIVLRRATLSRISREGLMLAQVAHPLMSRYVALQTRVETGLARFRLAPMGHDMPVPEDKGDEFEEFDQPLVVVRGGKA